MPGILPTTIEALALAVCVGLFHATTPVFVTTVPCREAGVESGAEPEQHDGARPQRPVDCGVIGGDRRASESDARRRAVHRRRTAHIGKLARCRGVEVVCDDDIGGGHRRDVRHADDVLEHGARESGAATDDGDLLRD